MHILFIDQEFHKTTKSADFFIGILRDEFEVRTFYYDRTYNAQIPRADIDWADVIISWEFLLSRKDLVVPEKPCIYIPMYDWDWGSRAQWKRIARSGASVISFCDKVSTWARRGGVNANRLLELHFAFNPDDFAGMAGDPAVAALWDRGFFGIDELKRLFKPGFFRKIIVFRRPQPELIHRPIADADQKEYSIEIHESEFLPKAEYLKLTSEPGVFIAPRPKEGIGMSFLEQFAMGKCVIAHNDATMNEYITDGIDGIVRDFTTNDKPISHEDIHQVREQVLASAKAKYERWQEERAKICDFIRRAASDKPLRIGGILDLTLRGLLAAEAALARLH